MTRSITSFLSLVYLHLYVTSNVYAASLPSAPSGEQDPVQLGTQILQYILEGIMTLGGGIAVVSLGWCLAKSISSGRFDGQRAAMVGAGGAGLAGVSYIGNMILGN